MKTIKVEDYDHARLHRIARQWSVKDERRVTLADVINILITLEEKKPSKVSRGTK